MPGLLASLYLILGALIAAVEIRRIRGGRLIDALFLFNGAYFLFFVFVPLNVLTFGEDVVRQKYAYQTWSHGDVWTAFALMLSYAAFVLGYFRKKNIQKVADDGMGAGEEYAIYPALWLIGGFFAIGALSLGYHINLVGGITQVLKLAPSVRTGEFQLEGSFLFVRQFAYFLVTAFMLSWAVYIDAGEADRKLRGWCWFLLMLLGILFVYYALSTYGRREFLYTFIICLLVWVLAGRYRKWGGLTWLLALYGLWFVLYSIWIPTTVQPTTVQPTTVQPTTVQPTTVQPTTEFLWNAYLRTTQGLADSFMHFVAAQNATLWQFGFLSDLREIPAQFLPSQALGFERSRGMFGETSEFILGRPLEQGLSGEEPLGLHGYLLVNFSYIGMFLIFYLMGAGYRFIDTVLRPDRGGYALSWLMFFWATIGALEFLREGVLILILKPRLSWWLAMGILIWFSWRLSQKRTSSYNISTRIENS